MTIFQHPPFRIACLAALLGLAPAWPGDSRAQDAASADTGLPAYRVELIVFENLSPLASGEDAERAALPPPPPATAAEEPAATANGLAVSEDGDILPAAPADPPEPTFFRPVEPRELADLHGRLARSSAYRPLAWIAWEQPGFPREAARPIELSRLVQIGRALRQDTAAPVRAPASGQEAAQALEGEITLWLSRYLHLGLDVRRGPAESPTARLDQRRRMRSRTVHYLDAPRLGAIAVILPVEPADTGTPAQSPSSSASP